MGVRVSVRAVITVACRVWGVKLLFGTAFPAPPRKTDMLTQSHGGLRRVQRPGAGNGEWMKTDARGSLG